MNRYYDDQAENWKVSVYFKQVKSFVIIFQIKWNILPFIVVFTRFSVWFMLENIWSEKWLGPTFFPLHRKAKLLSMQQMWHGLWLTCLTEVSPSTTCGMWTICLQINLFAGIKKLKIWVNKYLLTSACWTGLKYKTTMKCWLYKNTEKVRTISSENFSFVYMMTCTTGFNNNYPFISVPVLWLCHINNGLFVFMEE